MVRSISKTDKDKSLSNCRRAYLASRKINRLIVKERNKKRFLGQVCHTLTLTRGYSSAWIVLFDSGNLPMASAESGIGGKLSHALIQMKDLDFADFINRAFEKSRVLNVDQDLHRMSAGRFDKILTLFEDGRGMLVKIDGGDSGFCLMGVSIPDYIFIGRDERVFLEDTGADISFAIENIDMKARLKLLGNAVEQASETVIITDSEGSIQYVNPAFTKTTGYQPHEVLNKTPRIMKSGEQGPHIYEELWSTIKAGRLWHGEFVNRRKNGTTYHEEASIFPVLGPDGEIVNFTKISRDVTDKIKLEEQLRQSQKMDAVGRLAGGIAHDFNNLLTGIMGNAELLQMKIPKSNLVDEYVNDIIHISQRASELTRQLLTFSKRQDINPEIIDLNERILHLDKMLRRLISENIELVNRLGDDIPPILLDQSHLDQILLNLVINSRDAMPKGGKLIIETSSSKPGSSTMLLNPGLSMTKYSTLQVTDTGIGMSQEVLSHIFEPFFTTKDKDKGTGLGLSTVYGIVEQAGGHIVVKSDPGKGTTFKIMFPPVLSKAPKRPVSRQSMMPGMLGGHESLLIVEDEEIIRKLIKKSLSRMGYHLNIASSGEEALLLYAGLKPKPAMLLTDVILPDMNGIELASMLQKTDPSLKVVFMSGYAEDVISRYGAINEELNFIEKPFNVSVLLNKVRQVLAK